MSTGKSSMPTTSTGKVPSASYPVDPSPTLVYQLDIFLLIIVLVFAAFSAPRAVARLARRTEWSQGYILRSVTLSRQPRINLNTQSIHLNSDSDQTVLDLDGASTENVHTQAATYPYPSSQSTHDEKSLPLRSSPTVTSVSMQQMAWHMPMLSSLLPFVANLLHRRVLGNYSLGQVFLMAGYTTVILYVGLRQANPFSSFGRSGWICVSQLPFIYILASKNNIIGMLVGVGYEKLNYLHRLAGFLAAIAVNVHALGYFYKWNIAGDVSEKISEPSVIWGLVALVCMDILAIFSIPPIRAKFYNTFIATHVVASILVLFAIAYHEPASIPYIIVTCVFYGLHLLVGAIKTRITTATLRPIPELGLTRVEMSAINAGWRAGQHVRLRVLSTAMGIWGITEVHPFTIASISKTDEGLVLLCKKTGRWTNKMYALANTSAYGDHGRELGRSVKVMVEGPYGGVGNTVISSYSGAMFVVGGSGIAFALSTAQDLVRAGYSSDVTDIDVVWSIADPGSLTPMIPLFTALIAQSTAARLRISVYYTRASSRSLDGLYLPPGLTLTPGRPDIHKHLDVLVSATRCAGGCSGVFVSACGPVGLAAGVGEAVRRLDAGLGRAVGGIEVHEEVFGW